MTVGLSRWLIDRATVYTVNPSGGRYDVQATTQLHCRLVKISAENAGSARAELLSSRRLVWAASYAMPANAQVDVAGQRWNIVEGTEASYRNVPGAILYRAADVVRADVG